MKKIVFVADKGMLTPDNIQTITDHHYEYILSQSPRTNYEQHEELVKDKTNWIPYKPSSQLIARAGGKKDNLFYTKTAAGTILCYNPQTAKKAQITRNTKLEKLKEYITTEQAKETREKRKQSKQSIHDRIIKKLHGSHMSKYFDTKAKESTKEFQIKESIKAKEELLDGVFILTTNQQERSPEEIIEGYKQEASIEASFRVIKDIIELRPIYHYNAEHVKGHVFICVLAYMLTKMLEEKTGKTIKMLREETMSAVIVSGEKATEPDQIIGGEELLQKCNIFA